ncbi:response regulator [bacterium]|nr:response regulator [bacterium]
MPKPALIVDDNDGYVEMIMMHLKPRRYDFERAALAREGIEMLDQRGSDYYQLIVTDITMEGQTAGFRFLRHARKIGYKGPIMVASTGIDVPIVLFLAKWFMKIWQVDMLVPKKPLKTGVWKCAPITRLGISRQDLVKPANFPE